MAPKSAPQEAQQQQQGGTGERGMDIQLTVSVESMAGNVVWGPAAVEGSAPLAPLRDMVADAVGVPPQAVNLVYEDRTLQASLLEEAVPDGVTLKCVLDMVKGSIESTMARVREALRARNEGSWRLDLVLGHEGEGPVPNEEHCPEFRSLDWRSLEYRELTLVDTEEDKDNHAGKFRHLFRQFYFGTVDGTGAPAGFGFVLKQSTCWGEYACDFRHLYYGLFIPGDDYEFPMCRHLQNTKLVQGSYRVGTAPNPEQDIHCVSYDIMFWEKDGLFDGTEEEEE